MLGGRWPPGSLFGAQVQYLDFVGRGSLYGFLAQHGHELFRDEEFACLYCPDNGRRSVPPSLWAIALLLQTQDRVSDDEAKQRADFDLRWKVALGIEMHERLFAKGTLQLFRAQWVIHEQAQKISRRSLEHARTVGYLKGRKMRAALDTTHIFGRGAVPDTYNLIAPGIAELCRVLAAVQQEELEAWATSHGLARYFASSIKATADMDWDDGGSREAFLSEI
ncbi:MAG: transposase, partial [Armatimonadota bacterium]